VKKNLPILLLVLGFVLILGAGLFAWYGSAQQAVVPVAIGADVPQTLAGLALSTTQSGAAAIANIKQLHGADVPLVGGIVAMYGDTSATLWVAEAGSEADALQLVQSMDASINKGGSPFTSKGVFQFRNRDVYMLEGAGTSEFFMQSGKKVLWVSTAPEQSEQAMKEMLDFYP